ncbi:MAG: histidine kinase [Saprospiraceae bacterium]|nr:histidine kinase [Saprospiraceae bacterium]
MRHSILIIFLCWSCSISGQLNGKYNFRHIDQTDGLLSTMVKGIGQDEKGYMWILTYNGLQRYDGSRFVNYPEITNHSPYGEIKSSDLCVDTVNHFIEVINADRMERLDLSNNKIMSLSVTDILQQGASSFDLFIEENHDQWRIGDYGVIHYNKGTSEVIGSYLNINANQHQRNTLILHDPASNDLWVHNFYKIFIVESKSNKIYSSLDADPQHPLLIQIKEQFGNSMRIRYIMLDSHRNLWISTWTHVLLRYNMDSKKLITYSLKDVKRREGNEEKGDLTLLINNILEDRQKNIWFATDYAGLLLYNREQDDFIYITSDDKITNGLKYNFSINTIFQDRNDNIWVGTDRGINIFNPYNNYFQSIRHADGNDASLPKSDINDVIEAENGEIFIGTWGGGISVYNPDLTFDRNVNLPGPPEYELVWSFVKLDDGSVWAGAQKGHILMYDPIKQNFNTVQPVEIGHYTILHMVKDQDGNVLFGLSDGKIAQWNKSENKFYGYDDAQVPPTWRFSGVVNMYVDHTNRCWVTTELGLQEFDIQKKIYKNLYQPDSLDVEIGISFEGIAEYNDSTILLGSVYHGLYSFNVNSKLFSRIRIAESLNHTSVFAIKKHSNGTIWFTTNYNLYRLSPDLKQLSRYNMDPLIMNAAFGSPRFTELRDGSWVTSTSAEVIKFDPTQIEMAPDYHGKVEICGFKVFEDRIYIDSFLNHHRAIVLPYDKNFISIEFSTLSYSDFRHTDYTYRLSEVDKNWIHSNTKQSADYTDLKPGQYLFEVKADNGYGDSIITSLPITITPPWWGTFWFRALCFMTISTVAYFMLKRRIQSIRKQSALQQRIAETEMMALRSQMNPHFIFNCINSIDAMIQSNDKYRATVYLNKFAKLIRNVLDSSKENKVPLSKDMETLQLYIDLELFRHPDKFTASIEADDELLQNDYKVPPLIIQPYVENAILHGLRQKTDQSGRLIIHVTKEEDHIIYTIEDNGVGRNINGNANRDGKGYGMQMSNDRIRLFNDEEIASVQIIDLQSEGMASGTRIRVQLKMQ